MMRKVVARTGTATFTADGVTDSAVTTAATAHPRDPGELILPAGIAVTSDDAVYVSGPVFGPSGIVRVQ